MDKYEKLYNEALDRMRHVVVVPKDEKALQALKETIFPELAESEDERIRKDLIYDIERLPMQGVLTHRPTSEYISYLEKQKEQKHPNGCFTCDEYKKGYEEGRRNGFTAGYNKAMKEVEQKEQKPAVTHGETYRVDTLGTQQVIAGKMPQKPAEWSEEDEDYMNAIIAIINRETALYPKGGATEDLNNDLIAWLKSLRPPFKPSEEQMNCLCAAVDAAIRKHNESVSGYKPARVLKSLYEQLKKL